MEMPPMRNTAVGPRLIFRPGILRPVVVNCPSLKAVTVNVPWNGLSPGISCLPPSASVTSAPIPAACAASAAAAPSVRSAAAARRDAATAAMIAEEDHALRQQRMFLRDLVTRLLYRKQWRDFASPVDDDQLPGYSKKVKEPMDLSTLLWKVDSGAYATMDAFIKDVHLIVAAAKTYWGGLEQERREANDEELDENVEGNDENAVTVA